MTNFGHYRITNGLEVYYFYLLLVTILATWSKVVHKHFPQLTERSLRSTRDFQIYMTMYTQPSRHKTSWRRCNVVIFTSRCHSTILGLCKNVAKKTLIERRLHVAVLLLKQRCNCDVVTTSLYCYKSDIVIKTSQQCSYIVVKATL